MDKLYDCCTAHDEFRLLLLDDQNDGFRKRRNLHHHDQWTCKQSTSLPLPLHIDPGQSSRGRIDRQKDESTMKLYSTATKGQVSVPCRPSVEGDARSSALFLVFKGSGGSNNKNTTTNTNNTTATTGDSPQAQQLARLVDRQALLWRAANNTSNAGQDRDFWCGFLLGFFVGFVMLIWVWHGG